MRILVVDDEPAVREALERALRLEGYEVALAADGVQALQVLDEGPPNAVVLDLLMPRVDGIELCRRMRHSGDRTPALMLTARDASPTASPASTPVPTTIWSSRSRCRSCSPACERCSGGQRARMAKATTRSSTTPISSSIRSPSRSTGTAAGSSLPAPSSCSTSCSCATRAQC